MNKFGINKTSDISSRINSTYGKNNFAKPLVFSSHSEWLDFLRFASAMVVVLSHIRGLLFVEYSQLTPDDRTLLTTMFYGITRLGHEAVLVFFVLSGYLVGGKALRRMFRHEFKSSDYLIDRTARIWVPLIPALILSSFTPVGEVNLYIWICNLFSLQGVIAPMLGGNGPLWSLAYEVWFYILIYAVGRLLNNPNMDYLGLIIIGIVCLVFSQLKPHYIICWFAGAIFYLKPINAKKSATQLVIFIAFIVSIILLQITSGSNFLNSKEIDSVVRSSIEIINAISIGAICVCLSQTKSNLISRISVPMAAFSYTLYLTHYPILPWIQYHSTEKISQVSLSSFSYYIFLALALVLIAWLLYLPFERQTPKIRKRLQFLLDSR